MESIRKNASGFIMKQALGGRDIISRISTGIKRCVFSPLK